MDRISNVSGSAALDFVRPRDPMSLERLPNEILFMIFKWLLRLDPITLLGAIPGTTRRLRSIAIGTIGTVPSLEGFRKLQTRVGLERYLEETESPLSLQLAARFPRIKNLAEMISFSNHSQGPSIVSAFAAKFNDADLADETRGGPEREAAQALIAAYEKNPEAIRKGAEAVLDYVCDPVRINRRDRFGRTPLAMAIQYNSLAAVKHLLSEGARGLNDTVDDFVTHEKTTLLTLACVHASREIVGALLDSGMCNPNFTSLYGFNTLHTLAVSGNLAAMASLIEQCKEKSLQIRLDETNREGHTALALACMYNHRGCAAYLIDQGAATDVRNNHDFTPLALACLGRHEFSFHLDTCDTEAEARRVELVRTLLGKGRVDVDESALISAIMRNVATERPECRNTAEQIEREVVLQVKVQGYGAVVVFTSALQSRLFYRAMADADEFGCKTRLVELGTGILTPDALNQALRNAIEIARPFSDYCRRYFQALIGAGADPNILIDLDRETLLTHLVKKYYDDRKSAGILIGSLYYMYQTLVNLGADPSLPNTNGETPLDLVKNFYRDNPALDKFLAKAALTPLPDW
jgi:ankyrin repeat protein